MKVYKLADFGFSKKKSDVGGTILGTEQFMSPEIFSGSDTSFYGFEVDMWAFGVLFYFMLNMEFPFSIFFAYHRGKSPLGT
jgi:protein kinase A